MIPPDFKARSDEPGLVVDLLRHGAPLGGVKYRGALDDPLAPEGWEAMWATVKEQEPWSRILSSPLQRCSAFAAALGERIGVHPEIDPRLQEMNFGRWEGKTAAEILAEDGDLLPRFWSNPLDNPPPGGDRLTDVHRRVGAVWEELMAGSDGERILIVAHGGVIRVLLSLVLLTPLQHLSRITVPYAALARIRVDRMMDGAMLPRLLFCGQTGSG